MHPCREYWGQDVAYGSLVTGGRPRRADRAGAPTEIWIMDTLDASRPAPQAGLAGLMRRIGGLDGGEESSALLCAEFMRHLGALGAADGVSQIDWVMVRATDNADNTRSHLGATRVARVEPKPYAPDDATGAASSARPPAA